MKVIRGGKIDEEPSEVDWDKLVELYVIQDFNFAENCSIFSTMDAVAGQLM